MQPVVGLNDCIVCDRLEPPRLTSAHRHSIDGGAATSLNVFEQPKQTSKSISKPLDPLATTFWRASYFLASQPPPKPPTQPPPTELVEQRLDERVEARTSVQNNGHQQRKTSTCQGHFVKGVTRPVGENQHHVYSVG